MKSANIPFYAFLTLVFAFTSSAFAEDNYGAIATSDATGRWGLTYDYPSRAAAERAAVKECGADDCQAEVWFVNSCGAVAKNDSEVSYGLGDSRAEAEAAALDALGGDGRIVAWSCTTR